MTTQIFVLAELHFTRCERLLGVFEPWNGSSRLQRFVHRLFHRFDVAYLKRRAFEWILVCAVTKDFKQEGVLATLGKMESTMLVQAW
ncbi:hypothetical protein EV147_5158 [Cupriavidus agavae]|uniref:Uncharacterized protein n=1 Tax=Cupriavidus agavae TaxID=1001822 RepID=A0A4Q7R7V5_9BURK|nr:hypothetical protein EV147_5158 [Cupriavidus agavae]